MNPWYLGCFLEVSTNCPWFCFELKICKQHCFTMFSNHSCQMLTSLFSVVLASCSSLLDFQTLVLATWIPIENDSEVMKLIYFPWRSTSSLYIFPDILTEMGDKPFGMARPARKSSGWRAGKLRWKMHWRPCKVRSRTAGCLLFNWSRDAFQVVSSVIGSCGADTFLRCKVYTDLYVCQAKSTCGRFRQVRYTARLTRKNCFFRQISIYVEWQNHLMFCISSIVFVQ